MRCLSTYEEAMLSAILVGNLFAPMTDAAVRALFERGTSDEG
jgi:hypothetical protein